MARLDVGSEDVQGVVRQLVPMLLVEGSIAGVCRALNDALSRQGIGRVIHQNRIHSLLSDEEEKGVNEGTLALIKKAVDDVEASGTYGHGIALLAEVHDQALKLREARDATIPEIAATLGLPRAVVRTALFRDKPFALPTLKPTVRAFARGAPDWSYQDTAVARCLDAFRRRPTGRIALILPTGAGKTRVSMRVILERLAAVGPSARVIWVTHRKTLRRQAYRELGKLTASGAPLPADAERLANRVIFTMVGDLERVLTELQDPPCLIVVDEAHHAAAPSYQPVFKPRPECPVLFLTATPNRPDQLPIGIEEVAYTTTYRELAERHAIIIPEFIPFKVPNFDWSSETLEDLVDWLIDETSDRFRKVLVLAPRITRVEEFYDRFVSRLREENSHPISPDDVGFIHGEANSEGVDDEDFLDRFADKPRAVLVSAQMLLEGFDDPAIDTVVITYPTTSIIKLMQAAGRCVRQAPGKTKAYVVQADNADLAYRFDQRWLIQEIDDFLRPELVDEFYGAPLERRAVMERMLDIHNVSADDRASAMRIIDDADPADELRLLFYGKPYFGDPEEFEAKASWGVFVETPSNSAAFRHLFNAFCSLGAHLPDPSDFLEKVGPGAGLVRDPAPGSLWRKISPILTAAYCAREEVYGVPSFGLQGNRPRPKFGPTSWLHYITFTFQPRIPVELAAFLADCHNRQVLEQAFLDQAQDFAAALKVPLPLGGAEGVLLTSEMLSRLDQRIKALVSALRLVDPANRFSALAAHLSTGDALPLPAQFAARIEGLLTDAGYAERLLRL